MFQNETNHLGCFVGGVVEEWRPIPNYEGLYETSNRGRMVSLRANRGKMRRKILKTPPGNRGYLQVNLYRDGKPRVHNVHRLVAIAFLPKPPNCDVVRHLDGNPRNNNLENLAWGTQKDNVDDTVRCGRTPKGERHWNSNLRDEDILEIRQWDAVGIPRKDIGENKGISRSEVGNIATGRSWKHLGGSLAHPRYEPPNEADIREALRLRAKDQKKWTYKALGDRFKLSKSAIWRFMHRIT